MTPEDPELNNTNLNLLLALALLSPTVDAQSNWSQFRGADAQGVAVGDRPLPIEFGVDKNVIWKTPINPGHSSPCVWGDRIFLTGSTGRELETICIDRSSGALLWRKSIEVESFERAQQVNSPASPTPTADGKRVFVYFGSFGLICYDFAGQEQWRREMSDRSNTFGTGASPIMAGGFLILNRDTNRKSFVEAIDPPTGRTVWKTDRTGIQSGWSTPVVRRTGDIDELIIFGAFRLMGYDLRDGSERWSVPGIADEPCVTPAIGEGLVYVHSHNMHTNPEVIGLPDYESLLADYDTDGDRRLNRAEARPNQSILSRPDADGEGDHPLLGFFQMLDTDRSGEITETEWQKMPKWLGDFKHPNAIVAIRPGAPEGKETEVAWQYPRGVSEVPSPLYHEGRIYVVMNGGTATCLDAKTGELKFQGRIGARGPRYSSPVVGDGKIYTASARGVVTVLRAGDELEVLGNNDLGERIMATPALLDGRIYLRTEKHLYSFGFDRPR